jgi:hypothetical protein
MSGITASIWGIIRAATYWEATLAQNGFDFLGVSNAFRPPLNREK